MRIDKKIILEKKRRYRIRKKVQGTSVRPRLSLKLTNKHIYAQCINDDIGATLLYLSSMPSKNKGSDFSCKPNIEGARKFGQTMGQLAKKMGLNQVVFDRNGRRYHGVVKAFAEGARESLLF